MLTYSCLFKARLSRLYPGLLVLLLWWLPAVTVLAAVPGSGTPSSLTGFWKGPLQLPGGQLEVIFRLVELTNGDYFATLDVPLQKVQRLDVAVAAHADSVELVCAQANCQFIGRLTDEGKTLVGTWRQPGFAVPLKLARTAPASPLPPPRPTIPYKQEEVSFTSTAVNLRLAGTFSTPIGPGPFPGVVLLSDAGPQDRNGRPQEFSPLSQLADYLTRRGVAVLRYDDRGVGKSGGPVGTATTAELVKDAQAAMEYLRTRSEIDQAHLGLLGHGEGGNVALLAAALPQPPAFVIALGPYGLPGTEVAMQQQEAALRNAQTDPKQLAAALKRQQAMLEVIKQMSDSSQTQAIVANMLRQNNPALDEQAARNSAAELASARYRFFLNFDPVVGLAKVNCPVLLLYGQADEVVNPERNLAPLLKGLGTNKHVTARQFPKVNHVFLADQSLWPVVSGQPKPIFSPAAAGTIRTWIANQAAR